MPRPKSLQPSLCHHKNSGRAYVTINGTRKYLGKFGTQASHDAYLRELAEWIAAGRQSSSFVPTNGASDLTITSLIAAWWMHAQSYYADPKHRLDHKAAETGELANYRRALKPLKQLYSRTRAADFGPLALRAVMNEMARLGWCRTSINRQLLRIRAVFRWAVSQELLPVEVYQRLRTVDGFRKGKSPAHEAPPVKAISIDRIDAIRPFLPPTVRDMMDVQLLTASRPGEICAMRGQDIDMAIRPWVYRPASHKTEAHGIERLIHLGPRAQAIIGPRLKADLSAPIFSPIEAESERRALQRKNRQTKVQPSQVRRAELAKNRKPKRAPQPTYTVTSYRRAIARACELAFGMPADFRAQKGDLPDVKIAKAAERKKWRATHTWHPHQLRHSGATVVRKRFGIEAAQVVMSHKSLSTSELYAEQNAEVAKHIASEIG